MPEVLLGVRWDEDDHAWIGYLAGGRESFHVPFATPQESLRRYLEHLEAEGVDVGMFAILNLRE